MDLQQEKRIELLRTRFFNRTDKVAVQMGNGKPCPAEPHDLEGLLRAAVVGPRAAKAKVTMLYGSGRKEEIGYHRLGSYSPGEDQKTKYGCGDFDGGAHHAHPLKDPLKEAVRFQRSLEAAGYVSHLERSGSGVGYHAWVLFDEAKPAAVVRKLLYKYVQRDAPLLHGGMADPWRGNGIEIFPKVERVSTGGYGMPLWLPFDQGLAPGNGRFYHVLADGELEEYLPECSDVVTLQSLSVPDVLERLASKCAATSRLLEKCKKGEHLSNAEHVRVGQIAIGLGLSDDEATHLFSNLGNFKEPKTRKNLVGLRRGHQRPSCQKIAEALGFCDGNCPAKQEARDWSPLGIVMPIPAAGPATAVAESDALGEAAAGDDELPSIHVSGRHPRDIINDAWEAVNAKNAKCPSLFRRFDHLVRLQEDPRYGLVIEEVEQDRLYGFLIRSASWFSSGKQGPVPTGPAKETTVTDMVVNPARDLPRLEAVMKIPTIVRSGQLISRHGYYPEEAMFLDATRGLAIPDVSEYPSPEELREAVRLLQEPYLDFPFVGDADKAHILSANLQPHVRRLFDGPSPIVSVEAPVHGSGKTLAGKVISITTMGVEVESQTLPQNDEEMRKRITADLSRANPIILYDNASNDEKKDKIDSPTLAAAITSDLWTDRELGRSRMISMPNLSLWMINGNNPSYTGELARRIIRCRLNPNTDRPWMRKEFRHPNLLLWVKEQRATLVHAALTVVKAWIAAGRPAGKQTLGSFEGWATTMGGILEHAGIPGFLSNLEDAYAEADAEGQLWREFVRAWWARFQNRPQKPAELAKLCVEKELMINVLGDGNQRSQHTRLGSALAKQKDRIFGEYTIVLVADGGNHGRTYSLRHRNEKPVNVPEGSPEGSLPGSHVEPHGNTGSFSAEGNPGNLSSKPYAQQVPSSNHPADKGAAPVMGPDVPMVPASGSSTENPTHSSREPSTGSSAGPHHRGSLRGNFAGWSDDEI